MQKEKAVAEERVKKKVNWKIKIEIRGPFSEK